MVINYQKYERDSEERWLLIAPNLAGTNLLDLGCAEGFFVDRAKDLGLIAFGVDNDKRRNKNNYYAEIDRIFLQKLPIFDNVLFLSVWHHVVYKQGLDEATNWLKLIKEKTSHTLFFETGQSNEDMKWAKFLPNMGENPNEWILNYLQQFGFKRVVLLGSTQGYDKSIERGIYACII